MANKQILAWHFLPEDERLQFGRRTKVKVGQTLKRDPSKLSMCHYGLHASVRPLDAIRYAPGSIVCRVQLGGTIIEDDDKCVASRRTVLWMADASRELRLFACWCVRNTPVADGRVVWDLLTNERSRAAIEVAERYADGLATNEELGVARNVAGASAWDAWNAARAAACSARGAAWAATRAAACAAASAARAAACSARGAALDAAGVAQNAQLEKMLLELEP